MGVTETILGLLKKGYRPYEIVRMGFAKSTVYTVYHRYIDGVKNACKVLNELLKEGECIEFEEHLFCKLRKQVMKLPTTEK